jgi:DNA-directed RNA polymerase specialized sigma subunit
MLKNINNLNFIIGVKKIMAQEYINNKDFERLILAYLKDHNDEDIKYEMSICFYLLADNIIKAFNFKLIDRDDALQEGVVACFSKIGLFDPERGKAFNWFTTIILNHFRQLYRSAKNYIELKRRFLERQSIDKASEIFEGSSSEFSEYVGYRIRRNIDQYKEQGS